MSEVDPKFHKPLARVAHILMTEGRVARAGTFRRVVGGVDCDAICTDSNGLPCSPLSNNMRKRNFNIVLDTPEWVVGMTCRLRVKYGVGPPESLIEIDRFELTRGSERDLLLDLTMMRLTGELDG